MIAAEVKLEPCVRLHLPICQTLVAVKGELPRGPSMFSTPIVKPIKDDSWLRLHLGCKIHQMSARASRNSVFMTADDLHFLAFSDTNFCLWIPYGLHWLPQGPLLPRHMVPQNSGWLMQHLGTFGIERRHVDFVAIWLVVSTCFNHLEKIWKSMGRMTSHIWNGK